jgi:hypothetical protein
MYMYDPDEYWRRKKAGYRFLATMFIFIMFLALLATTINWYKTEVFPPLNNVLGLIALGALLAVLLLVKGIKWKTMFILGLIYTMFAGASTSIETDVTAFPAVLAVRISEYVVLGGLVFMTIAGLVWYSRQVADKNPQNTTVKMPQTCGLCDGGVQNRICKSCGARWCLGCDSWTTTDDDRCEKCTFILPRRT